MHKLFLTPQVFVLKLNQFKMNSSAIYEIVWCQLLLKQTP